MEYDIRRVYEVVGFRFVNQFFNSKFLQGETPIDLRIKIIIRIMQLVE